MSKFSTNFKAKSCKFINQSNKVYKAASMVGSNGGLTSMKYLRDYI